MAPWELARKRMQAQIVPYKKRRLLTLSKNDEEEKAVDAKYPTVVRVSPRIYTSPFDVFLSVTKEEGGYDQKGWTGLTKSYFGGFVSLYRGFWPHYVRALITMTIDEMDKAGGVVTFA